MEIHWRKIHYCSFNCIKLDSLDNVNVHYDSMIVFLQDLCRQLYPDSIRAQYGKTIIHNAVHCTDLPEDGELEVEYFFKLLAND